MGRDYKKEYAEYHGKAGPKKDRASRNAARSKVKKVRGAKAVKGKDVDHRDGNPRNNKGKNLRVQSKAKNRSRNR